MTLRIGSRVSLLGTLLAAALMGAVGVVGAALQERVSTAALVRQGEVLGRALSAAASSAVQGKGHFRQLVELTETDLPATLVFYGRDARPVVPAVAPGETPFDDRVARVMERGEAAGTLVRQGGRPAVYLYRAPLRRASGAIAGALELRLDVGALLPPAAPPLLWGVGAGLLALLALVLAAFSRRAIERPIARLLGGLDEVIRGDLTATLPLERSDEIGQIAYRFNEMTAQLRAAQETIARNAQTKAALEGRLRETEKLATFGQLSAEIAHEVGTPLNVIGARARVLEKKAHDSEAVARNARIVGEQVGRITGIIEQLLDLARGRAPERARVQLRRIIDDVVAFLELQIEQQGLEVVRDIEKELPPIWGDAGGLQQVVLNLALNAAQAMGEGGRLTLRGRSLTRRKQGLDLVAPRRYIELEVRDSGPGIAPEDRKRIFEPFHSTKRRGGGSGLGLAVVQGIVKDHDGWIEVDGAVPHGAIFRVYLPLEPETSRQRSSQPNPAAAEWEALVQDEVPAQEGASGEAADEHR